MKPYILLVVYKTGNIGLVKPCVKVHGNKMHKVYSANQLLRFVQYFSQYTDKAVIYRGNRDCVLCKNYTLSFALQDFHRLRPVYGTQLKLDL